MIFSVCLPYAKLGTRSWRYNDQQHDLIVPFDYLTYDRFCNKLLWITIYISDTEVTDASVAASSLFIPLCVHFVSLLSLRKHSASLFTCELLNIPETTNVELVCYSLMSFGCGQGSWVQIPALLLARISEFLLHGWRKSMVTRNMTEGLKLVTGNDCVDS